MVLLLYAACFLVTMFSARERRHRRPSVPEVRGDARVSLLLSQVETGIHGIMGRRFPDGGLLRYRK